MNANLFGILLMPISFTIIIVLLNFASHKEDNTQLKHITNQNKRVVRRVVYDREDTDNYDRHMRDDMTRNRICQRMKNIMTTIRKTKLVKRRTRRHAKRLLFVYCGRGKWRKYAIDGFPTEGIPTAEDRQILYDRVRNPQRGDRACIIEIEVPEEEDEEQERMCRATTILKQRIEPTVHNRQNKRITEYVYTDRHGGMWINKDIKCREPEPSPEVQELIEYEANDPKRCDRFILIEEIIPSGSYYL